VQITFRIADQRAGIGRKALGDNTPENISMEFFVKMTKNVQERTLVKFAEATRSTRKYRMGDVSLRWTAASTTARLAMMYMVVDDWDAAYSRFRAFFRLVARVEALNPSEAQRDEWDFESYVATMTQNFSLVEEILLEAEIRVTQKRVWDLKPGKDKSDQTYAMVERIVLSQAQYARLGSDYIEMNVFCRIIQIGMCVSFLVDLGFRDADIENGVEPHKSLEIMDSQLELAFSILDNALENYPERQEQMAELVKLVQVVQSVREFMVFGD